MRKELSKNRGITKCIFTENEEKKPKEIKQEKLDK